MKNDNSSWIWWGIAGIGTLGIGYVIAKITSKLSIIAYADDGSSIAVPFMVDDKVIIDKTPKILDLVGLHYIILEPDPVIGTRTVKFVSWEDGSMFHGRYVFVLGMQHLVAKYKYD